MWTMLNYDYKNLELSHLKNAGHKFKENQFPSLSLSLFFFQSEFLFSWFINQLITIEWPEGSWKLGPN